jgi:hypothetical protein
MIRRWVLGDVRSAVQEAVQGDDAGESVQSKAAAVGGFLRDGGL